MAHLCEQRLGCIPLPERHGDLRLPRQRAREHLLRLCRRQQRVPLLPVSRYGFRFKFR